MKKNVKIGYTEQSKAVTASVTVEYEGVTETFNNEEALIETQRLMDEALKYSAARTMMKMRS